MTRIIWIFIGLNSIAFLIAIIAFFIVTSGKKVGYMEGGWSIIIAVLCLLVILLAALPLYFSQSAFTKVFSGLFAFLPLFIASWIFISNKIKASRKPESFASAYFTEPGQLAIANAIEHNDTVSLKALLKGADLAAKGSTVHDYYGLNYLQFAARIRSNPISFPFDNEKNLHTIRILIESGSPTTPALYEAIQYLPLDAVAELLEAGADPNAKKINGFTNILFATIGNTKQQSDAAILLIRHGANVNVVNEEGFTVMMRAARSAGTSENWKEAWRLIRYILENTNADFNYVGRDGLTLQSIVHEIGHQAERDGITMCSDFIFIVNWHQNQPTNKSKQHS